MGRRIVSAQVTADGVVDQLEGCTDPEGGAGAHGPEQLRAADAVILGRETYEQPAKYWPAADGSPRRTCWSSPSCPQTAPRGVRGVGTRDRPRERSPPGAPRPSECGRRALSDRTKILRISPR
jgi:hypothetical protein